MLFSQGNYNFQNLRNEILVIADHLYVKISKLALFIIVLAKRRQHIAYPERIKFNEYNKGFECKSSFLCNH